MTLVRPVLVLATAAALAACVNVAAAASHSAPKRGAPAPHSAGVTAAAAPKPPRAGSRAEATALATQLLSRLRWAAGAHRLSRYPAPRPVAPSLWAGAAAALDVHELFELPEPMTASAASLSAHVPPGMSISVTGQGSGSGGETTAEVAYVPRSVPAGVDAAQLVLTIAPDQSGGSIVRADAQVIWYPLRSAAEYIDPANYHVLMVAVMVYGTHLRSISKVITSSGGIAEVADALNRSQVEPTRIANCPAIFAMYRLGFAVSRHSAPVVVVTATRNPCLGAQLAVDGRKQPPLQDEASVVAIVDRLLGAAPEP